MHNYLAHLIADLRQAAKNLPTKPYYEIPPEAEDIEYVIEWENAEPKPMHEWFGITKENFPPPEKLTDEQLELMVGEILKLWEAYNFEADLPENLPAKIAYKVLVDYFDKPVTWISQGTSHIEFCDYEPENCPFPEEFCKCTDFDDDFDMSTENAGEIAILNREIEDIEIKDEDEFLPIKKMKRYIEQLINDMASIADEIRQEVRIPGSPEMRGAEDTRQLIDNPYVTLEELTGIEVAQFPEYIEMDGLQTRKVLRAMLQLLDACKLKVYFPNEIPHEIKYDALRDGWDIYQVKHLSLSGDDIEFCTGDPMTCPFGEFCDCDNDLPDDEPEDSGLKSFSDDDELPF